jgi:hypothetical protein
MMRTGIKLAAVLAFVLAGCGGDKGGSDSGAGPTTGGAGGTGGSGGAGGGGTGGGGTGGGGADYYGLVGDALPAALFSIWGDAADNVWTVGARDDAGPLLLHYDGAAWDRVDTGTLAGDLWWVWGDGEDAMFLTGTGGQITRYTPSTGDFIQETVADPAYTFFGCWGTSSEDVWAVAGDPTGTGDGQVFHYDGTAWSLSATAALGVGGGERDAFKVWGTGTDDVWVVGTNALLMHYDGSDWTNLPEPLHESTPLTTVHGRGSVAYAVGGLGNAAVIKLDGASWVDDTPPLESIAPRFIGVYVSEDLDPVAVGDNGAVWWRTADGWAADGREKATEWSYHGSWVDPDGGLWAVGGDLLSLDVGVVLYAGDAEIPTISL